MDRPGEFTLHTDELDSGQRLDVFISSRIDDLTRSAAGHLIRSGIVLVEGAVRKASYRLRTGDTVTGVLPEPIPIDIKPEPVELDFIFQDRDIAVLNKGAGMVVHPAPGHYSGTLVNGLLYHCKDLEGIGSKLRPGIVHRLDKDTSGLIVVAKTAMAHASLSEQFRSRTIAKTYLALIWGYPEDESGIITLPIGRHPVDRKKMSIRTRKGREAETWWKVRERLDGITLLEVDLKTGRTHQIRVHLAAAHHPIIGDAVYGSRRGREQSHAKGGGSPLKNVERQMLHAWRIRFVHPRSGDNLEFEAPLPDDMASLIDRFRR